MVMSALGKAGVPVVERFDTSVTELELKFADNKLIGDGNGSYQQIFAGQIAKSDYHIIGGITELNYNIRSTNAELFYDILNFGGRVYVMNVGLDLRLVETASLRVVDTISLQKQIIGREIRAGVFEFFGDELLDVGVGERALEPMQLAVRSVVERAVYEMVRSVHGIPATACAEYVRGADEQLEARARS
jgi:curli production assembly/transport component CsgG/holdfast attachment protein HfaB